MSDLVKIQIPFSGFYESIHDGEIDRALEDGFNYDYEKDEEKEPDNDAIWEADIDHEAIRKEYCQAFVAALGDKYDLTLTFDEMTSPREYNFSTDRLFCLIPREQIDKIRKEVEAHEDYPQLIKDRFTSYDGFHSFYSNDYKNEEWTRETLDECQYEVLIEFWLDKVSDETSAEGWHMEEWYLTNDFEMGNWDSIIAAHGKVEEQIKENIKKDVANDINKAIDWIDNEFMGEHNMPSYAYEAVQELKSAIKKLGVSNVS